VAHIVSSSISQSVSQSG